MCLYELLKNLKPKFLANELQKIIFPECRTLLDVGCGDNSVVQFFNQKLEKTVGIDLFKETVRRSKEKGIHNEYIKGDVLDIDKFFKPKSFDCVITIDVIEHLDKKEAIKVINKMEKIARKHVVIQTTNGYLKQDMVEGNIYQIHKCGFEVDEFRKLGYKVVGMDGPKFLRAECAEIKWQPKILFSVLANILDPLYRYFPKKCFNLLASKKIE